MATVTRGPTDAAVQKMKDVLDEYERSHPRANGSLYRQNNASIRIRVVDDGFTGLSRSERHDRLWKFIADRLTDDDLQDISMLLPLTPSEVREPSLINTEFDHPLPSRI